MGYVDQQEYEADERFLQEYIRGDVDIDIWCSITKDACINNEDCDNCPINK